MRARLKKKAGGRGGAQLIPRGGLRGAEPPPFANGSYASRNTNLFIVIVVAEEEVVVVVVAVVVVEVEGIVIRTWVEPALNLGSNPGSNLG